MGKSTINGDFPYSYVSLPEGSSGGKEILKDFAKTRLEV